MRFPSRVVLLFLFLLTSGAQAADPLPNAGDTCTQSLLGATQISGDKEQLIGCLKSGTDYVWKAMASSGVAATGTYWFHWYGQEGAECDGEMGWYCPPKSGAYTCPDGYAAAGVAWYEGAQTSGLFSDAGTGVGLKCVKFP